jgi:hypothetical protein
VTLKAPQAYLDLLQQVQANAATVRAMNGGQFREWAARRVPGIDRNSGVFKALLVTLTEAGWLAL